ncbi:MAG: DUF2971 domain-containing protein [Chthoniobacteraceae bacterium]
MGKGSQIYEQQEEEWLSDDIYLWRYVPLRTLWVYLARKSIFIPSIKKLRESDPFEGDFSFGITWFNTALAEIEKEDESIQNWLFKNRFSKSERDFSKRNSDSVNTAAYLMQKHYFEFIHETRFAWCWFCNGNQDAAMWSNYGNGGVAIRTTVGKLKAMLEAHTKENFAFGKMRYIQYQEDELNPEKLRDAKFILRPHFLKRSEYKNENEVRFVVAAPAKEKTQGIILKQIDPKLWIEEIILWPGLKPLEVDALKIAIHKIAPKIRCNYSDLLGHQKNQLFATLESSYENYDLSIWDRIPTKLKEL